MLGLLNALPIYMQYRVSRIYRKRFQIVKFSSLFVVWWVTLSSKYVSLALSVGFAFGHTWFWIWPSVMAEKHNWVIFILCYHTFIMKKRKRQSQHFPLLQISNAPVDLVGNLFMIIMVQRKTVLIYVLLIITIMFLAILLLKPDVSKPLLCAAVLAITECLHRLPLSNDLQSQCIQNKSTVITWGPDYVEMSSMGSEHYHLHLWEFVHPVPPPA